MVNLKQHLNTEKISDQVYTLIKDRIINNEIKPGARLNYPDLQELYNISKTPLREALNRLQLEKFVEIRPRSGTYVLIPNLNDIIELHDYRKAIEWQAIQLAVPNLPIKRLEELEQQILHAEEVAKIGDYSLFFKSDQEFHKAIFDFANNKYLHGVKKTIDDHLHWYRIISATDVKRVLNSSLRHKQIIEACIAGEIKTARDLMEIHIEEVKIGMIEDFPKMS